MLGGCDNHYTTETLLRMFLNVTLTSNVLNSHNLVKNSLEFIDYIITRDYDLNLRVNHIVKYRLSVSKKKRMKAIVKNRI